MKIFLLRHAAVAGNLENRFIGATDSPLLPMGEKQARFAAKSAPAVRHIYVSPLLRCVKTSEIIWPEVEKTVVEELKETNFGPFEGKSHKELSGGRLYEEWLKNPDGGIISRLLEAQSDFADRVDAAWLKVLEHARKNKFESIAIVSHGGVLMRILSGHAVPRRGFYDWKIDNCRGFFAETCDSAMTIRVTADF